MLSQLSYIPTGASRPHGSRTGRECSTGVLRARLGWLPADGDRSLDLFPFITWDKKADGASQTSFMWRLYRNQRTKDGGRNLDLLFVPVMRAK